MIRQRITQYLDLKGISKYKFYKDTGLSNGFLDKEGAIGSDKCEKISYQYPELNLEWLITGHGEMLKNVIVEKNISEQGIVREEDITYGELYWKGRYDQLKEDHERLLKELNDIKRHTKVS